MPKKKLRAQIAVRLTAEEVHLVDLYRENLKRRDGRYKLTRERAVQNLLDEFLGIAINRRHI